MGCDFLNPEHDRHSHKVQSTHDYKKPYDHDGSNSRQDNCDMIMVPKKFSDLFTWSKFCLLVYEACGQTLWKHLFTTYFILFHGLYL